MRSDESALLPLRVIRRSIKVFQFINDTFGHVFSLSHVSAIASAQAPSSVTQTTWNETTITRPRFPWEAAAVESARATSFTPDTARTGFSIATESLSRGSNILGIGFPFPPLERLGHCSHRSHHVAVQGTLHAYGQQHSITVLFILGKLQTFNRTPSTKEPARARTLPPTNSLATTNRNPTPTV